MKTINLWIDGEGWQSFDFETAQKALEERKITIKEGASIGYGASIGSRASIGDGIIIKKTINIIGTRHIVNWYGTDFVHIGCHKHTIKEWLKGGLEIAAENNYSQDEINEYRGYVNFCKQLQKQTILEVLPLKK